MSAGVELEGVTVRFGNFTAVDNANLNIKGGEFFSFLGPSGCGKTTILRTVSGFLDPSAGRVKIGGQDMTGIGANKRPTALIFQNLALFPLMTVADNIAYGLRVRGIDKAARRKKADELLDLIALDGQGDKLSKSQWAASLAEEDRFNAFCAAYAHLGQNTAVLERSLGMPENLARALQHFEPARVPAAIVRAPA